MFSLVNQLLHTYEPHNALEFLTKSIEVHHQLIKLQTIVEKLAISVESNNFKCAKEYMMRYRINMNEIPIEEYEVNFIKTQRDKYDALVKTLKSKIIQEFSRTEHLDNCRDAALAIQLFSEQERREFLEELVQKVCETCPTGSFSEFSGEYLKWFKQALDDTKYSTLFEMGFKKTLIDAASEKLRDAILNEPMEELNFEMLSRTKRFENFIREVHYQDYSDTISIAFDPWCSQQINKMFSELLFHPTTVQDFALSLKNLSTYIQKFVNPRIMNVALQQFKKFSLTFLEGHQSRITRQLLEVSDLPKLRAIIDENAKFFEEVENVFIEFQKVYVFFDTSHLFDVESKVAKLINLKLYDIVTKCLEKTVNRRIDFQQDVSNEMYSIITFSSTSDAGGVTAIAKSVLEFYSNVTITENNRLQFIMDLHAFTEAYPDTASLFLDFMQKLKTSSFVKKFGIW